MSVYTFSVRRGDGDTTAFLSGIHCSTMTTKLEPWTILTMNGAVYALECGVVVVVWRHSFCIVNGINSLRYRAARDHMTRPSVSVYWNTPRTYRQRDKRTNRRTDIQTNRPWKYISTFLNSYQQRWLCENLHLLIRFEYHVSPTNITSTSTSNSYSPHESPA